MIKQNIAFVFPLTALLACATGNDETKLEIKDGIYDLKFERSGCAVLKTGEGAYYQWDRGCDGGAPDYEQRNVQRVGNRYYIEAASLSLQALMVNGFAGTWSFRGQTQSVSAKLRQRS